MKDITGESKDEFIRDVRLWASLQGRASVGRPARTYRQQLCADTVCSLEDLPGAMDDWEVLWEGELGKLTLKVRHSWYCCRGMWTDLFILEARRLK